MPSNLPDQPLPMFFRAMLEALGEDANREGLRETPDRAAEAWRFWTGGASMDAASVFKTFLDGGERYDQMVFQGNIPLYSHCEHHLAPIFGVAHVGYIPEKGRIVGLSKIGRVVDMFARRLQTQERITWQIADCIMEHLQPMGVGVVLRCRHLCMESRGIQKQGTITYTSALRGNIKEAGNARSEFLTFMARADAEAKV